MRIGELARRTGMTTSAIRFYEASGLLPAGDRGANGYRDYGADALKRLQCIVLARRLGISLESLRGLFAQAHGGFPREQILAGLEQRRAEIARMRAELDAQDAELARLARECAETWARGECLDPGADARRLGAGDAAWPTAARPRRGQAGAAAPGRSDAAA